MSDNRRLVSFVIPFFDCQGHLARAVESVFAQSGDDFELVLVNDGARDRSLEQARRLVEKAPCPVTLVSQANRGPGAARNLGARRARGTWVWFLDCDDELLADALTQVRPLLAAGPPPMLVAGGHLACSPDGRTRRHSPGRLRGDPIADTRAFLRKRLGGFSHGALIFARSLFERHGYPETVRNNEDLIFIAQILAQYPCRTLSQPLAKIHTHPDSLRHRLPPSDHSEKLTRLLFDEGTLPDALQSLRKGFLTGRRLSRFRALYRAGQEAEARLLYRRTIREHPAALFQWPYLRKYLRLLIRRGRHAS